MIGTALRFLIIAGGGGAGSVAFNKTIVANGATVQDNRLIGATEIVSIISAELPAPINKNIVFDNVTGTINLRVYAGDVLTITYNKP